MKWLLLAGLMVGCDKIIDSVQDIEIKNILSEQVCGKSEYFYKVNNLSDIVKIYSIFNTTNGKVYEERNIVFQDDKGIKLECIMDESFYGYSLEIKNN